MRDALKGKFTNMQLRREGLNMCGQVSQFCRNVIFIYVGPHSGTVPVLELEAKIRPVPALDIFLPFSALCLNGASSSRTGCPVHALACLTLILTPFLICPVL